jgi:hypothetical protein
MTEIQKGQTAEDLLGRQEGLLRIGVLVIGFDLFSISILVRPWRIRISYLSGAFTQNQLTGAAGFQF